MIASRLGAAVKGGVVIVAVGPGTPAATAGVQSRDIITAIDGEPVADDSAFAKIIDSHKPGDTIALTVARGRQTVELKAKLAERPAS